MPKDRSRDNEIVDVMGGPFPNGKKMKRFQAEHPDTKAMGIGIVGENVPILDEHRKRGRPSNAEKRVKELEAQLAEMQAQMQKKTEDAAKA